MDPILLTLVSIMRYFALTRVDGEEILGIGTSKKAAYLNAIKRSNKVHGADLAALLVLISSSLSADHSDRQSEFREINVEEYRLFRSESARTYSKV